VKQFSFCLTVVLEHEGGYVNHPSDPGGMTNLGVTARTWAEWTKQFVDDITEKDMKSLTVADVAPLYKEKYWRRIDGDLLPTGVDLSMFDMAVNAGPSRAVRLMQQMLRDCTVDGIIGPQTIGAIKEEYLDDPEGVISDYAHQREIYYRQLPHFSTFGKGWLKRVRKTEDISLYMLD
jgi:lysozyme family protein